MRPMVVNRKNWGGNRTARGAHTTAVLASVLRTRDQQGRDPITVLADIQHTGAVPADLDHAPQRDIDVGDPSLAA